MGIKEKMFNYIQKFGKDRTFQVKGEVPLRI